MTESKADELRRLAQAVVDAYVACEALSDAHTVGEWITVDEARSAAEGVMDDALGLAGALSADDDRSEAACTVLAALDAERHQQTRRMIAALYWRAGEAYVLAESVDLTSGDLDQRGMARSRMAILLRQGQMWQRMAEEMEQHL